MVTTIKQIELSKIHPHPNNPRGNLGDLTEFAESIKAQGILQPLTVVPTDKELYQREIDRKKAYSGDYTVVIGHRRIAAAKLAGLKTVPCTIAADMEDDTQISAILSENMNRENLQIWEEAQGFQGFKTMTYKPPLVAPKRVLTTDDIATRLPGEPLYNGYHPNRRRVELLQNDLIELDEAITRREEWMCAQVMFNAEIPVIGEGINEVISFDFENTVVVDIPWSDIVNSKPIEDLQRARQIVGRSGYSANIAVADSETMWDLIRNEEIQKLLDNKRYEMGIIAPEVLQNGATYIGFLRKANLHLYSYEGEFADNDNENPDYPGVKPEDAGFIPAVYPLVPRGKVVVAPARTFPAGQSYMASLEGRCIKYEKVFKTLDG